MLNKNVKDFTREDVTTWRRSVFDPLKSVDTEVFPVILRALQLATIDKDKFPQGITLRNTQVLSALMFWRSKKPLLSQIGTGEGKTFTGVTFAIMKVLTVGRLTL